MELLVRPAHQSQNNAYTEKALREGIVTVKVASVGPGRPRRAAPATSIVVYFSFCICMQN